MFGKYHKKRLFGDEKLRNFSHSSEDSFMSGYNKCGLMFGKYHKKRLFGDDWPQSHLQLFLLRKSFCKN